MFVIVGPSDGQTVRRTPTFFEELFNPLDAPMGPRKMKKEDG
jgi:hypothetical protein